MDTTRITQILSQWHEAYRQDFVRSGYTNLLDSFDQQERKHAHHGANGVLMNQNGVTAAYTY